MKVGIIGAGNVGGALAAAATKAGHEVTITAATPDKVTKVAEQTGATAVGSAAEAARGADVVVLAGPASVATDVVRELGDDAKNTVVIDSTNPMDDTYTGLTTVGTSITEEIAKEAPGTPVVKAFNTIFASRHENPTEGGQPIDGLYAGDDETAK